MISSRSIKKKVEWIFNDDDDFESSNPNSIENTNHTLNLSKQEPSSGLKKPKLEGVNTENNIEFPKVNDIDVDLPKLNLDKVPDLDGPMNRYPPKIGMSEYNNYFSIA